jgi:membrane associated rhomboid family serine protease
MPGFSTGDLNANCRECRAKDISLTPVRPESLAGPSDSIHLLRKISVTNALVGINVAVFVAMLLSGVSLVEPSAEQLLKWGANWGPLSLGTQPWRMISSNYVHIGIIHILLNMWCLVNLGHLAERIFAPWIYFAIYTCCGGAGSLASLWWHPAVVGAGASGAIFGLAGALIAALYLGKLPIPKESVRATLKSLLTFAGYNLFFGLKAGVDNSAHLGGLVAGLLLGAVLARQLMAAREIRQQWTRFVLAGMGVLLLSGIVLLRREYPTYATATVQYSDVNAGRDGIKALQENNFNQAVASLQKFVQINPRSAESYYLLGLAYGGANRPDDAINSFQHALQLKPQYADAEEGLSRAYLTKGMREEADRAAQKAAELSRR